MWWQMCTGIRKDYGHFVCRRHSHVLITHLLCREEFWKAIGKKNNDLGNCGVGESNS